MVEEAEPVEEEDSGTEGLTQGDVVGLGAGTGTCFCCGC